MSCTSEAPDTLQQHSHFNATWYCLQVSTPPHTIHPPHQVATILEESVVIHTQYIVWLPYGRDATYGKIANNGRFCMVYVRTCGAITFC